MTALFQKKILTLAVISVMAVPAGVCAKDAPERQAYFGQTHQNTSWSFDANESAFYYARVIEIPTPTWIAYDAFRFGVDLSKVPEKAKLVEQERAYTSPIWYTP